MANLPLATVEGSGNFQPVGTIINAQLPTGTRVFEYDGILYTRDNTPGYAIPNFDTKVPSYLKGLAEAHSYINLQEVSLTSNITGAGIASDGTIIRLSTGTAGAKTIERKSAGDSQYITVFAALPIPPQGQSQPVIIETDNNGRWIIALKGQLLISKDNGDNWDIKSLVIGNILKPIHDVKFGTGGVVLLSCRASEGNTASYMYRSTDYGTTWTPVTAGAEIVSMCRTTGTNWVGVSVGSSATRQSSDDGATWTAGPPLPITIGSDTYGNIRILYSAGGRFYVKNDQIVYTGTILTSLIALTGASPVGLGVDANNNAVAINSGGQVFRSSNGANFVSTNNRASIVATPYDVRFANGTWIDCEGNYITNTDLLASKSFTSWSLYSSVGFNSGTATVMVDVSDSGVAIFSLNYNTYLRSTDGFKTFEVRSFNVNLTNNSTSPFVSGVATDDAGNWVVTFNRCNQLFYSSDNGLTWVIKTNPAGNSDYSGVAGGGGAGRFLIAQDGATCHYTNDGFNTSSTKTVTGSSQAASAYPVYCGNGFFAFMGSTGSSSRLLVVNASTGVDITHILINFNPVNNSQMFGAQGTVFLGIYMYTGISTVSYPVEGNRNLGSPYSGIINGIPVIGYSYGILQVAPKSVISIIPTKASNLWMEGVRNFGYSATTFIKVN